MDNSGEFLIWTKVVNPYSMDKNGKIIRYGQKW